MEEAARAGKGEMEPESLYNLLQLPKAEGMPAEVELPQGERKKYLPPTSRGDPKFKELQKVLVEWINAKLLPEHIVVRSLEEDIFDGLILHHLFQMLTGLRLEVEEMALTAPNQRRKLETVLEAVNRSLQVEGQPLPWSMEAIFSKDLLATLHLLVALAKRFQPDLPLPPNVQVEVITMERTKSGLKSEKSVEQLTESGTDKDQPAKDVFDELFKLAPEKVNAVKEAIVSFVNQNLGRLGLSVQNLDTQFADGVLLLLLIGQLEGFFLHLKEFYLTPTSPAEMLHNVTLALELLKDEGLLSYPLNPEGERAALGGGAHGIGDGTWPRGPPAWPSRYRVSAGASQEGVLCPQPPPAPVREESQGAETGNPGAGCPDRHREQGHQEHAPGPPRPVPQAQAERPRQWHAPRTPGLTASAPPEPPPRSEPAGGPRAAEGPPPPFRRCPLSSCASGILRPPPPVSTQASLIH
ncbi:gamma-parvin isoform X3 [Suricata suricatta]|uniref:gamma-parvin isoform X3 n=1 Tax=Suricata suricatta TaxID=37032 RepID=UPI0011559281|nr:gamma-parvin isoform X3 [Suricata suricatta]